MRLEKPESIVWILSLTLFLLLAVAMAAPAGAGREASRDEPGPPLLIGWDPAVDEAVFEPLRRVYERRGWQPLWFERGVLRPDAMILVRQLRGAALDGLDPHDYAPPALLSALRDRSFSPAAKLDLWLSAGLVAYARDLRGNGGDRSAGAGLPTADQDAVDLQAVLEGAAEADDLRRYLEALAPANRPYRDLRRMLLRHQGALRAGGWPAVGEGPSLRLGSSGERVRALRARLRASHDLSPEASGLSDGFDAGLEQAVRRFQERHGLRPDGVVGRATLDALNVPLEARIRQIRINMERARRMPDDLGERHLLVNIPGFDLEVREAARRVLAMRVVVGRPSRPTPVFSSTLSHLVIHPFWHVPKRIAGLDLLPKLQAAPDALVDQGIRVLSDWSADAVEVNPSSIDWRSYGAADLPFKLRQDPGPANALGRIKFMMPNTQSIYLHDTPSQALFERPLRAFSSGCVRLERPLELAELLYRMHGWSAGRLYEALASGRNQGIRLAEAMPVHITYLTAWLGDDGSARFRADIYGWDDALGARLAPADEATGAMTAEVVR